MNKEDYLLTAFYNQFTGNPSSIFYNFPTSLYNAGYNAGKTAIKICVYYHIIYYTVGYLTYDDKKPDKMHPFDSFLNKFSNDIEYCNGYLEKISDFLEKHKPTKYEECYRDRVTGIYRRGSQWGEYID